MTFGKRVGRVAPRDPSADGERRGPGADAERVVRPRGEADRPAVSLLAVVCVAALAVLATHSRYVDRDALFLGGLGGAMNDQAAYVSTARNFADGGTLESNGIFPSTLAQKAGRRLVMPGHAFLLAACFRLFGYGTFTAYLPSLACFVASALLVFCIGCRLYGRQAAIIAAALFTFFPFHAVISWTAMAEMTVVAAALAALAAFVCLPARLAPWVGPLLVALPTLFRETGAVIAVPMFLLILRPPESTRWRWRPALTFALATAVVFAAVVACSFPQGRPTLLLNNLATWDPLESTCRHASLSIL